MGPQYVTDFKALLKKLSKGEPPPPRFELEARSIDGDSFPATLDVFTMCSGAPAASAGRSTAFVSAITEITL